MITDITCNHFITGSRELLKMALLPNDWPACAELSEFEAICDTDDVYFVSVRKVLQKVVRVCDMKMDCKAP